MSLNWFDFAIITVIVLSILISFFRGFLRETISLITWVAGLIFAMRFAPKAENWLNGMIEIEMLRYIIAFVLLFMAVFILGLLMNMAVKRGVDASGLSFIDRLLGGAFGATRGILLVAVVLMFMTMTAFKDMSMIAGSKLSPSFMPLVTWLDGFLPEQLQNVTRWLAIDDSPFDHTQNDQPYQKQPGRKTKSASASSTASVREL